MSDGTTILFGLPGVEVREVHRVASGRVAQVVTADPVAAACPGLRGVLAGGPPTAQDLAVRPRLRRGAVAGRLSQIL